MFAQLGRVSNFANNYPHRRTSHFFKYEKSVLPYRCFFSALIGYHDLCASRCFANGCGKVMHFDAFNVKRK